MNSIRCFLLSLLCFIGSLANAQLTLNTVDPGPYSPGSNIAALFSIDPATCIRPGNRFNLRLSDAGGNFAPGTIIGFYDGFYSTFVNGIIPSGTAAGNYKVRIESTNPALISTNTKDIVIAPGTPSNAVKVDMISDRPFSPGNQNAWGFCSPQTGSAAEIILGNGSSSGNVDLKLTNELDGTSNNYTLNPQITFTPQQAHYTAYAKVTLNGTVGTRAYFIINNKTITSLNTSGNNTICLMGQSGATLSYPIDLNQLKENFPGNTYVVNWGDASTNTYTVCDLQSGKIEHTYFQSSCGRTNVSGSITTYNAFGINLQLVNPFCGNVGTPISTTARVITVTEARISGPPLACTGSDVTFTNASILGDDPNTNAARCGRDNATFNWYVDGILTLSGVSMNTSLVHRFTTNGIHRVRLRAISSTGCQGPDAEVLICVQNPPVPSFTVPTHNLCGPTVLTLTNTSVVDATCDINNEYTWNISPSVQFINGTNQHSVNPQISFTSSGVYSITLTINTATCGSRTSAIQDINVDFTPQSQLSPDATLCNLANAYEFSPWTSGPTKTIVSGTAADQTDTFTWVISPNTFSFEQQTDLHTKYPYIKFNDYTTYTITLTHKNNCGTQVVTQHITFEQAPSINLGPNQEICYDQPTIQLHAVVTGTVNSQTWSGGNGSFSNVNDPNAIYTPTNAERNAGEVRLKFTVTTSLTAPCDIISAETVIKIKNVIVTSASSKNICTGTAVSYQPSSNTAGTTFTWTATGSPNASNYSTSGTGDINDIITNTDAATNATVTYTITPTGDGCTGNPFTFTVTITPLSVGGSTTGNQPVCSGNNNGQITLSGHVGTILKWQSSTDNTTWSTDIAETSATLTYSNLTTTTYYRAVIQSGNCAIAYSSSSVVTVNQPGATANAGPNQTLCNQSSTILAGNQPGPTDTGLWEFVSGSNPIQITTPSAYNTSVTGLVGGGTYVLKWTITGVSCPPTSGTMTISNLADLTNNTISTATTTNCTGQVITITGSTPTGGNSTYTYIWESSPTGNAPWTVINGQISKDLNFTVSGDLSFRRTVNSGTCTSTSNILNTIALPAIANNSIASDQTICLNAAALQINGSQPTGGDGINYTYGWEQSINGTTWSAIIGASGINYAPGTVSQTTWYRRIVSSGPCMGAQQSISAAVKITVNPNARAEFTYTNDVGCVPFILDANNIKAVPYTDRNNGYTWYANGVQIGTGINFPGYTINTYNTSVDIRLVVTSSLGCASDETTHTFKTRENIVASYTQSVNQGCGPLSVSFTNTTNNDPGNIYEWFVDGVSTSTARDFGTRIFNADPSGIDRTYTILLRVKSVCGTNEATSQIIVKGIPVPAISAVKNNGCSPFDAEFINTTPGGANNTYVIDFGDGTAPASYTWGSPITHRYTTNVVKDFEVRMTATNICASITSDPIIVRVSPNSITPIFFVAPSQKRVCVGTDVIFRNNTSGAKDFTYDFKDGTSIVYHPNQYLPETISHRFLQPGTYVVSMLATNDCSVNSTTETIEVIGAPSATISANVTTGCKGLNVSFSQTNIGAVSFLWDFGDGSTSTDANPAHVYLVDPGQYTVSLTVINSEGCPSTVTRNSYITIVPPPSARFAIAPAAVISIPDYTFKFTNESINGAETYKWSFGDGDISTQKDPTHTYLDTGKYTVTLRTYNQYGCVDSVERIVQILGVPGYTFVPNSFIPGGESLPLKKFMAVGSGMKSWKMQVFNKWGQVLWETTKLEDGKPVEGWDGTFNGVPQPQGIYFWKIEVEMINGIEWKGMSIGNAPPRRTGQIYLIR